MRRRFAAALVTACACLAAAFAPASADAVEYAHHVGVAGGANAFGPFVSLFASEVVGYGEGIGCAGIRGISGVNCESSAGAAAAVVLGGNVNSEPYIHNHSGFTSFFNGWYY